MIEMSQVEAIIDKYGTAQRELMSSLLDIQNTYHYLPREALARVSDHLQIPLLRVYQVASFYDAFSLEPRGAHVIRVCLGSACHVRAGLRLVEHVGRLLNIEPGQTTRDQQFTLEAVKCLGCCVLGPVMVVDGKYYANMAASKVERVLKQYRDAGEATGNG
jgi:NADH-quinone oxidoreductase subunit E